MGKHHIRIKIISLLPIVLSGLLACTSRPEFRIGVISYSIRSPIDIEGKSIENAVTMAAEEINSSGGAVIGGRVYKVVPVIDPVTDTPEAAVTSITRLINQEKVAAVLGPVYSSGAIPSGEVAERSGIPMVSAMSTNPKTTLGRRFVFRIGFMDDLQARVMATFAMKELKASRAAILYNITNPYSRNLAEIFRKEYEEKGGEIVAFETYFSTVNGYVPQIDRISRSAPQVVFLPNYTAETAEQAAAIFKTGLDARLIGPDAWDWEVISNRPEFDDSYMTALWSTEMKGEVIEKFIDSYKERFGEDPSDTAALTYDAFNIIIEAARSEGKATPEAIRDGLYNLGPYAGASGNIDYVWNGDPERSVAILHLKNGKQRLRSVIGP
jgi:branched-chain amino acid transport system substrate-binding protein